MAIIYVGGSRTWKDKEKLYGLLDDIFKPDDRLVVGDAVGVDDLAISYAYEHDIPFHIFAVGGPGSRHDYPVHDNIYPRLKKIMREDMSRITWWAGGHTYEHDNTRRIELVVRLAIRTKRALAPAQRAYLFFEQPDSRGTRNALREAIRLRIPTQIFLNNHHEPKEIDMQSKKPYVFTALSDNPGWFEVSVWHQPTLF